MKFINKLLRDDAGATAIEYGLIAALISLAAVGAFNTFGTSTSQLFTGQATAVDNAVAG